ncbi:uncharacterized protein LOC120342308 [Styela clava]
MPKFYNSFEECLGIGGDSKKVCLQIGAPGAHSMRNVAKMMKEATIKHFDESNPRNEEILQYGCCSGNYELKQELAKYLSESYRNPVKSEDIFVHNGASQGLSNLLYYYFQRGETLFVEDPSYWNLICDLKNKNTMFSTKTIGIGMDINGLNLDELENHLKDMKGPEPNDRYPYRAALYLIPVYQNPTGYVYSDERCKEIIQLARKYDLMVISDDVYNLLTYSSPDCDDPILAKPPTRLFWHDNKDDEDYKESVVTLSSFSKFLAPGLRVGWFEMPRRMFRIFETYFLSDSGSGWNEYTSGILASAFKLGLIQDHVKKTRVHYRKLIHELNKMITDRLSAFGVTCNYPTGGEFLWIALPRHLSADVLLEKCKEEITFIPGSRCSISQSHLNYLRVCYAFYDDDVLIPAVGKLCDYIKKYIEESE